MHVLCRLGYMFWSDVNHNVIVRARLNGTELKILVDSSINVSGNVWAFAMLYTMMNKSYSHLCQYIGQKIQNSKKAFATTGNQQSLY